jgi:IclR family transcriptional regulator, acetate operon repressor
VSDLARQGPAAGVQSVARAFDILETIADHGGELGISQLGGATGLPYATIHRLVSTLAARGYLRQDAGSRRYQLGPRLLRLSSSARVTIEALLGPHLRDLAELSGETANLAVLQEGLVVYVAQAPSRHMLRTFTEVGNRVHAHSTAVGKAMLAHKDQSVVEHIIEEVGLPRQTPDTIYEPERLFAELDDVRTQGYALDREEQEVGVRCLAMPVLLDGEAVAAMSISAPAARLQPERSTALVEPMQAIVARGAEAIRRGRPPRPGSLTL